MRKLNKGILLAAVFGMVLGLGSVQAFAEEKPEYAGILIDSKEAAAQTFQDHNIKYKEFTFGQNQTSAQKVTEKLEFISQAEKHNTTI